MRTFSSVLTSEDCLKVQTWGHGVGFMSRTVRQMCVCVCFNVCVPEASVLGGCSSGNDLGDKDGRVVSDVRIISSSCNAEAQTGVPLNTHEHIHITMPP